MIGVLAQDSVRVAPNGGNDHQIDMIQRVEGAGDDGEPALYDDGSTLGAETLEAERLPRPSIHALRSARQNFHR